jgi:hypothetical protein
MGDHMSLLTEPGLKRVAQSYTHLAPTELKAVYRLCRTDFT